MKRVMPDCEATDGGDVASESQLERARGEIPHLPRRHCERVDGGARMKVGRECGERGELVPRQECARAEDAKGCAREERDAKDRGEKPRFMPAEVRCLAERRDKWSAQDNSERSEGCISTHRMIQ